MPSERNFITKIIKYNKVISVPNSISVFAILKAAKVLIEKCATDNTTQDIASGNLDIYIELVDRAITMSSLALKKWKNNEGEAINCGPSRKLEREASI